DATSEGSRARRGPHSLPRRRRPATSLSALLPPRHHALLRQGRARGHPLLLPWLALRLIDPAAVRRDVEGAGPSASIARVSELGEGAAHALEADFRFVEARLGAQALRVHLVRVSSSISEPA